MKLANEIFQDVKPETAVSVFQYLRDEQRDVYKASLSSLAANRKLRPVFVQRKPAPQQIEWLVKNVKLRGSVEIATQVLQLWLLKAHPALLTSFLDGLGIEHDGEGAADDIPDELDAKKLKSTVEDLLQNHDPELVRIYLHIFQLQRTDGWEELTALIESTPALQFDADDSAAATESPAKTKKAPAKKKAAAAAATTEEEEAPEDTPATDEEE
ncbi:MAG: hypothetical protein GXX91_02950 [Verrucomicrobiaceae bacterium]|nr:hypothetical protein [Verrucomicrobiaceae bacterium]